MTQESGYKRPRSWQEMRDQEIRWLVERTRRGARKNVERASAADGCCG